MNAFKNKQTFWLLFTGMMLMAVPGAFAQQNKEDRKKDTVQGEIVMTTEELESLLTMVAEKRKAFLRAQQEELGLAGLRVQGLPMVSGYAVPQSDEIRLLHQKLDFLIAQNNGNAAAFRNPTVITPGYTTPNYTPNAGQGAALQPGSIERAVLGKSVVYFDHNSTKVSAADFKKIDELMQSIGYNDQANIIVLKGFASQVGSAYYNNQLSYNRSDVIKQHLIKRGVSPANILILHHGADPTLNAKEARRVEVTVEQVFPSYQQP